MSKYSKEVADIFSSLDQHQIELFIKKLNIDEIKIVQLEVLPKLMDLDRRRYLKKVLTEYENEIYGRSDKSEVISNAIQENKSISHLLKSLHEDLKTIILSDFINDEARKLFLERATEDELFIINRKLLSSTLDAKESSLFIALLKEIEKRKGQDLDKDWKDTYQEHSSRKHVQQLESNIWQSIIKNIQQANLEVIRTNQAVVQNPAPKKPWYSRAWSTIKSAFSQIGSFFSSSSDENSAINEPLPEPIKLSVEETDNLEKLRIAGAQYIANITGVVEVGKSADRNRDQIELSMRSRFGMALAAQMVAATVNENHRKLMTTVDSLVKPEDDNDAIRKMYKAMRGATAGKPEHYPLRVGKEHIYARGANPHLVTAIESEIISKLAEQPDEYSRFGIELSKEERDKIRLYNENMERSKELMQVMQPISFHWGGYNKINGRYVKVEEDFDTKQTDYENKLAFAGKFLQKQCLDLKDGESLYLDTGLEGHAMQLVIKRIGNEYKLSTYDPSGALENTSIRQGNFFGFSLLGLLKLNGLREKGMRRNAYTFTVPQDRLQSTQGLDYLTYLIRTNTMAGWAQSSIELDIEHTSMTQREDMSFFERFSALNNASKKYKVYMEKFASIASPDSSPYFEEVLQRPQNTQNCFAKKAQSCQLYELGKATYKKVRLAVLMEQRENLIKEACGKLAAEEVGSSFVPPAYIHMIETIEPQYLSPSELYEASTRLSELGEPPSPQYYQKYFTALIEVRSKLTNADEEADVEANELAIKRINDKIAQHAKELYSLLSSARPPREDEIKSIFSPEVCSGGYDWGSGVMPLKQDPGGSYATALQYLSDYSSAQAWKSIIQIINHQIKKLSVNERSLNTTKDRLPHASYRKARTVTLNDLENANIVNFTKGFYRKDEVKVEINIAGKRYEIDKKTFFKLVVKNKEALTNPKVMGLLDYLRNASQEIEERYKKNVYPAQSEAFEHKLDQQIKKAEEARIEAISRFYDSQNQLEEMLLQYDRDIASITDEITVEEECIGDGKNSVKLRNLKSRHDLLQQEKKQVHDLHIYVSTKIQELNGEKEGSALFKIDQAIQTLEKLRTNTVDVQSINARNQIFIKTQLELERVEKTSGKMIEDLEDTKVEQEINERIQKINKYRQTVIKNYLQTNAEYQILDELSTGRMGTEKDRNRDMYLQKASERIAFLKQGKNTFLTGSVFYEIQRLNRKLKAQVEETVERRVILGTDISDATALSSFESAHDEYAKMEEQAQKYSRERLPEAIKKAWVQEMFAIWLQYESPELLYKIQGAPNAVNQAFHHFIEQKANIKYGALREANYPIELKTMEDLEQMGWKPISDKEIEQYRETRKEKALFILKRFKEAMGIGGSKPKEKDQLSQVVVLTHKDLEAQHDTVLQVKDFVPPEVVFLSQSEREALDGSTLTFLRKNPMPAVEGVLQEQCTLYFDHVLNYLHKLRGHNGLENKAQRISEFCHTAVKQIFNLPYSPPSKLVIEIANAIVDRYRDDENSISNSFLKLENNERIHLLTSLIKLSLSQIVVTEEHKTKVDTAFYSTLKQWERLIVPVDEAISRKLACLEPGGAEPQDVDLLGLINEVDLALHESPVSLEGLHEGQKGLQIALMAYGKEKGVDKELRKLADRLGMRNRDALLAHQFIHYYSDRKLLLSSDGINSTQGRELFSRALLDAFQHATVTEKHDLLNFIQKLQLDDENEPCKLKVPHEAFVDEILMRCANIAPALFQEHIEMKSYDAHATQSFIARLTDESSEDGVDRLLGFAKEINLLTLKIENALLQEPVEREVVDQLYAQLICANLAYQLIVDQASEKVLANLKENFEYTREMSLVQANINQHQEHLVEFSRYLNANKRATQFNAIFNEYARKQKFDGVNVTLTATSPLDIPGFINLGGNKSLDVLHGVIYIGNNKLGVMPVYIQSHIALQELGIHNLPFKPQEGSYAYVEGTEVKASITKKGGDLIVQRELRLLDGDMAMLQYIAPEKMDSVPIALKQRLNAEHFFIDLEGTIHAYTSDFRPVLQLEHQDEVWRGFILDHQGNKAPVNLDNKGDISMVKDLSQVIPQDELVCMDEKTVYIPSIAKYVVRTEKNEYLMVESLADGASKKHLQITEQGSAFTTRELNDSEIEEKERLEDKINELQERLAGITTSDLVSSQSRSKLKKQIKDCESRINEITVPEYFVFIPDSKQIKVLEQEQRRLREVMQQAYVVFKDGEKDKGRLAVNYEKAKEAYLQNKKALQKAYDSATYLRTFDAKEGSIHAKDFQSILHVGLIPGKTTVLTQLLGTHVLKSPLKPSELEDLRNLKEHFISREDPTNEDRIARIMLIGTELHHHILERGLYVTGKLADWDRSAYKALLGEFANEAKEANRLSVVLPLDQFRELWSALESEFATDQELQGLFTKPVALVETGERKPININTKTTSMPIEILGSRTLIQFKPHSNLSTLIDPEQVALGERLHGLEEFRKSIDAQEEGYYYENYGLFQTNTLEALFGVTAKHAGIGGLTKEHVAGLFKLMHAERWIGDIAGEGLEKYQQLTRHPSEFYSAAKITGYLTELGFERSQIRDISERLEIFLYQTAVSGGSYSIKDDDALEELKRRVTENQEKCNLEYLQALDKIESTLAKASSEISVTDLNAAYLLNDYRSILSAFPEEGRAQVEIIFTNGMTRMLFYKTELDHLNDVQCAFPSDKDDETAKAIKTAQAIAMLHTRRNYQLDKLLESELPLDESAKKEDVLKVEEERKMQRAFLLFESEFGHRCNARQVNIFRGLLLDEETNPDKIDSAQARMGFGKTTLLPLIALYKTGNKLVRFIVPKSALETNTSDMSITLTNIMGRRAIKDDFQRYRIATDPEPKMGEASPRLKSLRDAKADLQKRLVLYRRVRENREVLVQAPNVRNSMECQAKIFLDMLLKIMDEPEQQKELMECIALLNEIRSMPTISVFDELDATQDPTITDVNYTSGEKVALDAAEIYPLEVITQTIGTTEDKSVTNLGKVLLEQFDIEDADKSILNYITSLQVKQPSSVTPTNSTEIYLIRAILTDPVMLSIFTEKQPGTDFGVWFENAKDGSRLYDYDALKTGREDLSRTPLLIAIPYSAANTPKPQGSRFDNPEVTAITTLLYYLDSRTELNEIPHLEFLIDSFRKGLGETLFLDSSGKHLDPEFKTLFEDIKELASIEDPLIRNEERAKYFATLEKRIKERTISPNAFRKMLARTIIQEQVKFDAGKANSNRYEQGTPEDTVIGFSGTAGDTSSHFKESRLDPAADGNMTLGIMGRKDCQETISLDTTSFAATGEDYTTALIKQLTRSFTTNPNTRTLIDVGGLCKASNRAVAKEIALQLKNQGSPLRGVIFYDDVTNTKKLLVLGAKNKEKVVDLTPKMVAESDRKGSYFTYYDQSHSRGADIKQMDGAHAILTLNFTVTNNDYKQAIMRMRKIVDKALGQSFSTAVPEQVRKQIISDLQLDGCTLHLMSELPPDDVLEKYKGSYIVYRNSENGDKSLF
ncbi:hypothetical protein EP47_09380 [Legionella norrlandica]|uniref:Uncharacterized protein n=1 Tax=Legionella norrlandica TaxID=1498499 RepID=A0A0A2SN00_9GAMM|nr:hypothetical protein [Legionella norrlandica]KGP62490.1 hypothetical protein EP47_09380 [Legionella norrlandica]